jgi:hypothetical protein
MTDLPIVDPQLTAHRPTDGGEALLGAEAPSDDMVTERRAEANRALGMGLGIGVVGVASAALFGAVCPVCIVAAPALLATGLVRHARARRPPGRP